MRTKKPAKSIGSGKAPIAGYKAGGKMKSTASKAIAAAARSRRQGGGPGPAGPACPLCGSTTPSRGAAGDAAPEIDVAHEARRLYVECLDVMARARERADLAKEAATRNYTPKEKKAAHQLALAIIANDKTVLNAVRTAKPALELLANILGKLQPAIVLNLHASAEYMQLRDVILTAVAPFRPAMLALASALDEHLRQRQELAAQTAGGLLEGPVAAASGGGAAGSPMPVAADAPPRRTAPKRSTDEPAWTIAPPDDRADDSDDAYNDGDDDDDDGRSPVWSPADIVTDE